MKMRSAYTPLVALLIPLALGGCDNKGVAAVPAKDDTTAATSAKSPDSGSAIDASANPVAKADASVDPEGNTKPDDPDAKDPDDDKGETDPAKTGAAAKADGSATGKTAPKTPEVEPTVGEKKVEGSYAAWMQSAGKYKAGTPGNVVAVLTSQGEYKCNEKYPFKFKFAGAPAGVTYGGAYARGASVTKKRATLSIPFTPTTAGPKTISGTFHFSVCNEESCLFKKQAMSVTVNVEK